MDIRFTNRQGIVKSIDSLQSLHFHHDELRNGRDGELVARHVRHDWIVEGEPYLRLDCAAALQILLLNERGEQAAIYGPHQHFSSIDGIAFADHMVLAHFDAQINRWYVLQADQDWPALLVEPAPK